MKTVLAALVIVMSLSSAFAEEDAAKGSEHFCPLDRVNTKANLEDQAQDQDEADSAVAM